MRSAARVTRAEARAKAEGSILEAVELDDLSLSFGGTSPLFERLLAWRQTRTGRLAWYAVEVGVVTGLYYGAARAGLRLAYLNGSVTALWPPVGVGIAALVIGGPGLWPGIVAGDLLVADFSTPLGTVLGQTIGNTLEVVVAALLFIRLAGGRRDLERVWDVLALVICAIVGTLISAAFGVVSLRLGHVITAAEFGSVFRTWWLSDFSGALVFAPLLLVWAARRSWRIPGRKVAEGALLLAILIALIEVPSQQVVPYIVFPILIWAALRFGPVGAATTVAIVSALTVWNTAQGSGPFVRASITHTLLASQLFVAVAALDLARACGRHRRTIGERRGAARTHCRTGCASKDRHARRQQGRIESRVRASHRRGGPNTRSERGQPGTLRPGQHRDVHRCVESKRQARVPGRLAYEPRRGGRPRGGPGNG